MLPERFEFFKNIPFIKKNVARQKINVGKEI